MKIKSKISLLAGAIVLAGVVYMPQARADIFELGTIKNGNLFAFTFSGLEVVELNTFDLYHGDNIIVKQVPTTWYSNSFGYIRSNYTYPVAVNGVSNSSANEGNYSQFLSVSHVSEPEEWAMILVGVGLVSYQIRRKQKLMNHSSVG